MRHLRRLNSLALAVSLAMLSALLAPIFTQPALAQATTGSISGTVTDQNRGVVSNATIVAKNQATGVESPRYRSTGDGVYNISNLIPGIYTFTVESPSFKRAVFTDVTVRLGETAVIDVTLQPGGISETVTVTASTETTIQKDTSQVSGSFQARQVQDLPSNVAGAGIDTLALLVPGVTPAFGANANGTTLSVNGNRARSNNFSIDGQDNNDLSVSGPAFFISNQDQVQDFQVITNNFSAQYGRNQGAIVNIVTKAGSNEVHGTGFWYHRDRKLFESLTNLERAGGLSEAPPLLYNVYGGTVGGPIKKDRAFFFGSFQGIRTRETFIARGATLALLPEELPRLKAAFPNNPLVDAITNFSSFAITDFGTVQPRADLPIDTVVIARQSFRAAFPERSYQSSLNTPSNLEEFSGRFDLKLTDRDNLWSRYLYQDGTFKNGLGSALGLANGFIGDLPFRSQNTGTSWTRQVSGAAVNEFRFAYQRLFVNFGGGCNGLKGCIPDPKDVGTAHSQVTFANLRGENTGATLQTIGGGAGFPQGRTVQVYQFTDNHSFTRGRHQLTTGADVRRLVNNSVFLPNFNGTFAVSTAARLVGNAPFQVTLAVGPPKIDYNETDQFYFIQDDWKVRDNLTLNIGVRYEYTGQPINTLHDLTVARESNPDTAVFLQSLPLEARTVPRTPADKNNWAPRFGFAYSPRFWKGIFGDDATVVRGGFSIAYDPAFYNILTNVAGSAPVVFNNVVLNSATAPVFPAPSGTLTGENVRAFAISSGQIARNTFDPRLINQTVVAPDFHSPYAEQWSLGIQRQLSAGNVVEARYLGTHGVGLFQTVNRNPRIDRLVNGFTTTSADGAATLTFPGFPNLVPAGVRPLTCVNNPSTPIDEGACNGRIIPQRLVLSRDNSAQSIYHSLQTRYAGRLLNQLTLGAAYTLSKGLDNVSEIFFFQENSIAQNPFNITSAERSYSGFDRRHALALNCIWDLPFYRDQKGWLGHALGGWQINGTYNLASGIRYTPVQATNNFFASYVDPLIADVLKPFFGNPNADPRSVAITDIDAQLFGYVAGGTFSPTGFFSLNDLNTTGNATPVTLDQAKYVMNGPGAAARFGAPFGNVARNNEVGPRINQVNAGFFKTTQLTERIKLQFRAEMFNLFNHPNPGIGLAASVTTPAFPSNVIETAGTPGGAFNEFRDIEYGRRVVQFGLKVIF